VAAYVDHLVDDRGEYRTHYRADPVDPVGGEVAGDDGGSEGAGRVEGSAGESATGKSTIGLAINRALLQEETNQKQITPEDYPYGVPGATEIRLTLNLSTEELESLVFRALLPDAGSQRYPVIRTWLEGQGNQLEIIVRPSKTGAK